MGAGERESAMWVAQEGEGNEGERTNQKKKKERQAIKDQCTADNGPVERERPIWRHS